VNKALSPLFHLSLCTLGCLYASSTQAQVTSDGTVNTQVNQNGDVAEIRGGQTRGDNLFHSFQEFSVGTGNEAFFNNATDIANIFSRVTGAKISNIDGLIRANGSANLFLINPAGIIFGQNARLDVGGSFYGSTADSVLFEDAEFSATDLENPPVLTINAPIGLGFRDNPGDIINLSVGQNPNGETNLKEGAVGLQVPNGETLAILGGDVLLNDGNLTAKGGQIEIGSVRGAGKIGFTEIDTKFVLNHDSINSFGDVTLQNSSIVDATAGGGGNINIFAKNLFIDSSGIYTGIDSSLGSVDSKAGNISINATDIVKLTNISAIKNDTFGIGNAGNIKIQASKALEISNFVDVESDKESTITQVGTDVGSGAIGNGGSLFIETQQLTIAGKAQLVTSTDGVGNAGNTTIRATEFVDISDTLIDSNYSTSISTQSNENTIGNAGNLTIETDSLNIKGDDTRVTALTFGDGDAGNLLIKTGSLKISDGAEVQTISFDDGDAGNLTIEASEIIQVGGIFTESKTRDGDGNFITDGNGNYVTKEVFFGGIFASAIDEGKGNAGTLKITTDKLVVQDFGTISGSNFQTTGRLDPGKGAAGDLEINANSVEINNNGTITAANANGVGGSLTINADSLSLDNKGKIEAFTESTTGKGGVIDLNLDGNLFLSNNSKITANTKNGAEGGIININANAVVAFPNQNNDITANAAQGNGGDINMTTKALLGLEERSSTPENQTNDIDVSSDFGLNGTISIFTPDINPIQGATSLPSNIVTPEQITAQQTCQIDQESNTTSGLNIKGKDGVTPAPDLPLNSHNIIDDETSSAHNIPEPIETAQGKIQPARGIKVTKDGRIILTAYRTNNAGERIPEIKPNCSSALTSLQDI
jgi:filamentous hemagglutinin family protein